MHARGGGTLKEMFQDVKQNYYVPKALIAGKKRKFPLHFYRSWCGNSGLLQGWLTLHLWDEVLQEGCQRAEEVPTGVRA